MAIIIIMKWINIKYDAINRLRGPFEIKNNS